MTPANEICESGYWKLIYSVPHPDVFWYRLNGMGAQKSSCNTFSIYISRKTWMKYSLRILKNKNLFKRLKYPSSNVLSIKHFWHSATITEGFRVSLNYPILNFKKNGMSKKRLDAALILKTMEVSKTDFPLQHNRHEIGNPQM